ncbi:MAG TPA: lysylphosphatidylglycerol synthase domain-containing protein [Verrucomicrobiae bacterium]
MKKTHAALLLLGFAFLVYLLWQVGARQLGRELALLGWGLFPFIALEWVAEGLRTVAWSCCLSGPHRRLSWWRLFQIRMAGYAINYLTPTAALGGEATKSALLHSHQRGPEAVTGVLAGKLCTGIGHLLFVLGGSAFVIGSVTLPRAVWTGMFLSSGVVGAGMLAFLLLQKYGKLGGLIRWLAARRLIGWAFQKLAGQFNEVDEALKAFYRDHPGAMTRAVAWELIAHATGILQTWWFFVFLHEPVSVLTATTVWVLGLWFDMLTFAVPMNLGTLEGSRIVAFKAVGLSTVPGMTYGIALRFAQMACACLGLITYTWLMTRNGTLRKDRLIEVEPVEQVASRGNGESNTPGVNGRAPKELVEPVSLTDSAAGKP